jgi:hypothetical protein
MASKVRGAKNLNTAATVWKWPRWVFGEEGPHVDVFDASPLSNEVFGTTLAEAEHQKPVAVKFARLWPPRKQVMQVRQCQHGQPMEVGSG